MSGDAACLAVGLPEGRRPLGRASGERVAEVSSLALTLRSLRPYLSRPDVTELCINTPGEAFLETPRGWERERLPFADFDWCRRLSKLVANATHQRIDEESPLLSASLPSGERIQIVMPPATTTGTLAITIRRPASEVWSIEELARRGIFRGTRASCEALDDTEQTLLHLLATKDYEAFMRVAVKATDAFELFRAPAPARDTKFQLPQHVGRIRSQRSHAHDADRNRARRPLKSRRPALLALARPQIRLLPVMHQDVQHDVFGHASR